MNAQQAAAFALANGAELTIDGRTVNKEREKFALVRPKQPGPAPQVTAITPPAAAPDVNVDAKLAEQEARLNKQMQDLTVALVNAMQSMRPTGAQPPVWEFSVQYGPKGEITNIRAVPQ